MGKSEQIICDESSEDKLIRETTEIANALLSQTIYEKMVTANKRMEGNIRHQLELFLAALQTYIISLHKLRSFKVAFIQIGTDEYSYEAMELCILHMEEMIETLDNEIKNCVKHLENSSTVISENELELLSHSTTSISDIIKKATQEILECCSNIESSNDLNIRKDQMQSFNSSLTTIKEDLKFLYRKLINLQSNILESTSSKMNLEIDCT